MRTVTLNTRLDALKFYWCRWNGQAGTPKQMARIRCTEQQLDTMLRERGWHVTTDPDAYPTFIER